MVDNEKSGETDMANGMWGANTEELRLQSDTFQMRGDDVAQAFRRSSSAVQEVVWEGRDAERFKNEYASQLAPMVDDLCAMLFDRHTDMQRQAQEQDDTSSAKGGGKSLLERLRDFLTNNPIYRFVKGIGKDIRKFLQGLDEYVDFAKDIFKNSKEKLEKISKQLNKYADKFNIERIKHIGGPLSKFMSFGSAYTNAMDSIDAFKDGNILGGLYSGGKAILDVAGSVPSPIAPAAKGISAAIFAAETAYKGGGALVNALG